MHIITIILPVGLLSKLIETCVDILTSSHLMNLFPAIRVSETWIGFSLTTCTPGRAPAIVAVSHQIYRASITRRRFLQYVNVDRRTMMTAFSCYSDNAIKYRREDVSPNSVPFAADGLRLWSPYYTPGTTPPYDGEPVLRTKSYAVQF